MNKSTKYHRPALAAIAAAIACSTVPAAAQETAQKTATPQTTAPAQPTTPIVLTPPVATPAPVQTAPQTQAPVMAPPREVVQPLPERAQPAPTPDVKSEAVPVDEPKAATPAVQKSVAPKTSANPEPRTRSEASVTAVPVAAAADATAPTSDIGSNIAVEDATASAAMAPTSEISSEPVMEEQTTATEAPAEDGSILPWALGGIALLGLAGGAVALRRRSTRQDAYYDDPIVDSDYVAEEPVYDEPAPVARIKTAPPPATKLPIIEPLATPVAAKVQPEPVVEREAPVREEQTASPSIEERFRNPPAFDEGIGYHESIVDDGPTPDNPFTTRKARLKRARYLDRIAAEEAAANGTTPPAPKLAVSTSISQTGSTAAPSAPQHRTVTFGSSKKVDA